MIGLFSSLLAVLQIKVPAFLLVLHLLCFSIGQPDKPCAGSEREVTPSIPCPQTSPTSFIHS